MDFQKMLSDSMSHHSIITNETIIADGRLRRFHVQGDKTGSKDGFYALHCTDGVYSGMYGSWRVNNGEQINFCSKLKEDFTLEERKAHIESINKSKSLFEEEKKHRQNEAKVTAKRIWGESKPADVSHPYLIKKQIKAFRLRCDSDNRLIVPLYGIDNQLHSLQFISVDGDKRFLLGGAVTGNYFPIGNDKTPKDRIYIGEGVATCITIHEVTGCAVACAFNCGNLLPVAQIMRTKYPDAEVILAADNDIYTPNNPGLSKAKEAANAVNAKLIYPDFTNIDTSTRPTDFNDLMCLAGIEDVKKQLEVAIVKVETAGSLPKSLPDSATSVMPFDIEMLPKSISDYVIDVAERQQCPIDFVAVTALCALSAVLGRKILICPKQNDDWTITPNLWGAIIGRPSAMKSPAMKAALEPLKSIESDAAKQYELAKQDYETTKELLELGKASAKEEARKQLKAKKTEEAKATLTAANFIEPPPTRKRLIINDSTVEKFGELLNENPNGLLLVRDELSGWLSKLAKEEYQSDRAFYLECFDGNGHFIYDRIGRGTIDIKNTTLSIIGGIQPSKIIPLVRSAIKGTADDGLVQRLQLAVWPDDNKNWAWVDRAPNTEAKNNYHRVFESLNNLNPEAADGGQKCLRFTREAQVLFIQWMEENQKKARADEIHPALESCLLKLPKTVASIALLLQIVDDTQSVAVDDTAMIRALSWARYLITHAERLYNATNQDLVNAHLILERLNKLNDEFSVRDVLRKGWAGLSDLETIRGALEYLVDYKHLTVTVKSATSSGGRPTTYYRKTS
ncbi:MAG: DUF3987 domain-containing protein [Coxiellaceae bacterium]|nr:DUF3987 domain-containing protein [Coxiellaceae bacterium]